MHGLESNPVPIHPFLSLKDSDGMSRPCLVSLIFADLPSLHPPSFHFYTCISKG